MKHATKILSVLFCIALLFSVAACGGNTDTGSADDSYTAADMSVACLKGPTGVGMAQLMDASEQANTANNYTFTVAAAADEISGKIVSGEINIASVPTNLAAKLYQKTEGNITMLAVNTLGVLSILENGDSVSSVADLKGKTIYSTGEGSNPEYILRYILSENGIDPDKDVTIQYLATNDELIAALVSGTAEIAMVPEPAATTVLTKKDTLNRAFAVNDAWEEVSDSSLMMGCVVTLKSYAEANPDAIAKFLEEYEASIDFAQNNIDEAATMCETYGIIPGAAIAKAAIPNCNLTFVSGKEMKNAIGGYFDVLFQADPTSIGGKLPADDFYYGIQ